MQSLHKGLIIVNQLMNITEINRAAELTLGYTEKEGNKTFFTLLPDGISIDKVEKELINQALYRFAGNQTQAARCLPITRDSLRHQLKKDGLSKI